MVMRVNGINSPKSALCPVMARWQAGIEKEYVGWYVGKVQGLVKKVSTLISDLYNKL